MKDFMPTRRDYTIDITHMTGQEVARLHETVERFLSQIRRNPSPSVALTQMRTNVVTTGWTSGHVALLLELLTRADRMVQRECIEGCDAAGFIPRELIYQIGGYDPERRLNRWTVPIDAAVAKLKQDHGLPQDAADPVTADYPVSKSYVAARGYTVAAEIVAVLREEQRLSLTGEALLESDLITAGEFTGSAITHCMGDQMELTDLHEVKSTVERDQFAVWDVWRTIDSDLVVDTHSRTPEDSVKFFRKFHAQMGEAVFTSAVVAHGRGDYAGLLLTTDPFRQIALRHCRSGYEGTGPDVTIDILVEAGFDQAQAEAAVYSPERETTPIILRK